MRIAIIAIERRRTGLTRLRAALAGLAFGAISITTALGAWPLPPAETHELYVASFDNDLILVYDSDGIFLRSFGHADLNGTRGVMVSSQTGEIYVASELNSRILVFDRDDNLLRTITHAEMIRPTGLAEGPDGRIYASAWTTDRVVVFDSDETYLYSFNGGGLDGPNCVAFDSQGDLYVASALTANVLKYDSSGNFLFGFTGGGLSSPMSVARSTNDVLYVSGGGSDDVVRFDTSGNMIDEITLPAVFGPQGVVFDANGHWYVSSFYQDVIHEYDQNDTFVRAISDGPQDTPRSMSFYTPPTASAVPSFPGGAASSPNGELSPLALRAWPNPVMHGTHIVGTLHSSSPEMFQAGGATLHILDAAGRIVRVITPASVSETEVVWTWDGRDDRHRPVPGGLYFYHPSVRGEQGSGRKGFESSETGRLVVIR